MDCASCGTRLMPGAAFCHRCRRRVVRGSASGAAAAPAGAQTVSSRRPVDPRRPAAMTALAVLDFLVALVAVTPAAALARVGSDEPDPMLIAGAGVFALLAGLSVAGGVGLLQLEEYGRRVQLGLAMLWLPLIPVGTLVSILEWLYLTKPATRWHFSGRLAAPAEGRPPAEHGLGLAAAIVGILLVVVMLAAILFVFVADVLAAPAYMSGPRP